MGRLLVYDLSNYSPGEIRAVLPRSWNVYGSQSVGTAQQQVQVERATALKHWLLPGAQVAAHHPKLPLWAGMLDVPWGVTLPVTATVYPQAYMLSQRQPTEDEIFYGSEGEIAAQVIQRINAPQNMYVQLGVVSGEQKERQETFKINSSWFEQLRSFVARCKKQMLVRAAIEDRQLINYIDIADRVGVDTGFLLHDGDHANIEVLDAVLDGPLVNMLTGVGSQSTGISRMSTSPLVNQISANLYRLRSMTTQYQNVVQDSDLYDYTQGALDSLSWFRLRMPLKLLDVGRTLNLARPGNSFILHTGNVYLPGGVQGWRGKVTLNALAYDERSDTVGAQVEGLYYAEQ